MPQTQTAPSATQENQVVKNSQAFDLYQLALKGVSQKEAIELTGIKKRNVQWYWSVYGLQAYVNEFHAAKEAKKSEKKSNTSKK